MYLYICVYTLIYISCQYLDKCIWMHGHVLLWLRISNDFWIDRPQAGGCIYILCCTDKQSPPARHVLQHRRTPHFWAAVSQAGGVSSKPSHISTLKTFKASLGCQTSHHSKLSTNLRLASRHRHDQSKLRISGTNSQSKLINSWMNSPGSLIFQQ